MSRSRGLACRLAGLVTILCLPAMAAADTPLLPPADFTTTIDAVTLTGSSLRFTAPLIPNRLQPPLRR